jgi:hypothetical protein
MDHEPMLPPPVYRPEEVAHAILHAAVHSERDIVVGGGGKALTSLKEFSPGAYDLLAPAIIAFQKRSETPRDPKGALHNPGQDGEAHGDQPGYVRRTSTYTRASLHPAATAGLAQLLRIGGDGAQADRLCAELAQRTGAAGACRADMQEPIPRATANDGPWP